MELAACIDPVELRLRNVPTRDPATGLLFSAVAFACATLAGLESAQAEWVAEDNQRPLGELCWTTP